MPISIKIQTRVAMITLALMLMSMAVQAQSGRSAADGIVGDQSAARQGKFVVVVGATVELENLAGPKYSTTTDDKGVYKFGRIRYGDYSLSVTAPGYRPYFLKFSVNSEARAFIAVLLSKE